MKTKLIIAAMLAANLAHGQMFAQLFGGESWTPASLNPIAWYKGEDNAIDSIGSNNGKWVSTPSYYQSGICGSAFSTTTGVTSIQLPTDIAPTNNQPFSISIWVKWPGTPAAGIIAGNANVGNSGWYIRRTSTTWDFAIRDKDKAIKAATINHGGAGANWTHIVGTYNGNDVILYIDGVPKNTQTSSTYLAYASYTYIARYGFGNISGMTGYQDDMLIFNRALTATEIKLLYDESVLKNGAAW